jgi:DNA-binding transcriptional MerR regulator
MAVALAVDKSPEAFRTISEVAVELDVPQHVLRFWETKFPHLKPLKRAGGRRYYRPEDLDLLRGIRSLLYSSGLTIKGAQKILREQGPRYVMELGRGAATLLPARRERGRVSDVTEDVTEIAEPESNVHQFRREPGVSVTASERAHFSALLDELLDLKSRLKAARKTAFSRM